MKKILITLFATFALAGVSHAGSFGIGVSGSFASVSGSGSETTGAGAVAGGTADTHSQDVTAGSAIGSVFLEYAFDNGWAFGYEHVPGSADVSDKHLRAETAQGISGTDASGAVERTAKAQISDFNTLYIEAPMGRTFVKLGFSQVDVETLENAVTDSGTYGNKTIDGMTYGFGFKGELGPFMTKTSVERTDFDNLSLSSSTNNSISADLDVTQLKFSLMKQF